MKRLALLAFAALAACTAAQPITRATLPQGAFILPGEQVSNMLSQCSRSAPLAGESSWQPSAGDVLALEQALPAALAKAQPAHDWAAFPGHWVRQYVGIVRSGHRFIYGNFVPADERDEMPQGNLVKKAPLTVCDGGAAFFGAEFDVAGLRVTHLAFNGALRAG